MSTEWSTTTKHIVGVGLALLGLYILYISRSVLTLVIIAALVAFLLMPVVNFLNTRLRVPKIVAVLLSYLLLIILLLLAPLLLLPPIIDGVRVITNIDYQKLVTDAYIWSEETLVYLSTVEPEILGYSLDLKPVILPALDVLRNSNPVDLITIPSFTTIFNSISSALTFTFNLTTSVAGTVFSGFFTFILTLLYAIYLSLSANKFTASFLRVVPEPYRPEIAILLSRLRKIWRAYFRGQIILMIIIGLVTWIGNTALGVPGAFTLAVIAGLLELIPNLGPILAAIPAILIALLQGSTYLDVSNPTFALIVIGLYVAVQQLENTVIVPRVLGDAVELHPLVVMVGVVVGASVAGILGALLAAPVIASVREVVSYLYAKILSKDPFPPRPPGPVEVKPSFQEQLEILVMRWHHLVRRAWTRLRAAGERTQLFLKRWLRQLSVTLTRSDLATRRTLNRLSVARENTQLAIKRPVKRRAPAASEKTQRITRRWLNGLAAVMIKTQWGLRRLFSRIPLAIASTRLATKRRLRHLSIAISNAQIATKRTSNPMPVANDDKEQPEISRERVISQDQREI
jgi:predicted PurR-regulated permease PerM